MGGPDGKGKQSVGDRHGPGRRCRALGGGSWTLSRRVTRGALEKARWPVQPMLRLLLGRARLLICSGGFCTSVLFCTRHFFNQHFLEIIS